ncbi:hypothetical protein NCI01_11490 [Nocardioides sp. STR3]|uniref:Uncharacterized protein n=1 Tax=Nocardioides pinisoli TaxID=2950279 RepID=A0ABT1KXD6_9ACTN|nr:hypothetical protein [Nocardioides pinisoli]MCP3422422.1 hypothetical protein [Nocardioides pinisoli]
MALGLGLAAPSHLCGRVEPGALVLCGRDDLTIAHRLELVVVGSERLVDEQPVLEGETGGLPRDQRGPPLGDSTGPPGGPRVGELATHDPRQPEVALAAVGRLPPREGDLRGDTLAAPGGRDAQRLVVGLDGVGQLGRQRCLRCAHRAGQLLQRPDRVDATGVVEPARAVERGLHLAPRRRDRGCGERRSTGGHVTNEAGGSDSRRPTCGQTRRSRSCG